MAYDDEQEQLVPRLDGHVSDSAIEAVVNARDAAEAAERHSRRMIDQLEAMAEPARYVPIELTPTSPYATDNSRDTSASIGLLNPNGEDCWLGIGGLRADSNGFAVPAGHALILPLAAEDVDVAADPPPGARIVVMLLRFKACQPFFIGTY